MHSLSVNFNGGEQTPLMAGRVDFDGYRSACVTMENFMVRPYGGAFKAPGTEYIGEVKDSSKKVRLITMRISRSENYVLEVGAGYFRFWKEGDPDSAYLQVKSGYTAPAHSTSTTYQLGMMVLVSGTTYLRVDHGGYTDSSFASALSAGYWRAISGGIIEWPNSYTEAELAELDFHPINRILVIVHANHPPLIVESVDTSSADNDYIRDASWSTDASTAISYSFLISEITWSFPPLTEHPLSGEYNKTITIAFQAAVWTTATNYTVGQVVKNVAGDTIYYCTVAHTSGSTTQVGVGASWTTVWRWAGREEVFYTLTASSADIFSGLTVGDLIIPETESKTRTCPLTGSVINATLASFCQGPYAVSTEWPSSGAPLHELWLEESDDGVTWRTIQKWITATVYSGTIQHEGEAPAQGAFYRLNGVMTSGAAYAYAKFEPRQTPTKLPVRITSITSSTVLVASSALPNHGSIPYDVLGTCEFFYLPAFSAANGYPRCVGFHNLRLWLGGTAKEPNRVRGSCVDDFFNFATGDNDSDGFNIVLNSNAANLVQWIAGYRQGLVVGTEGDEWTIQGGGDGSEVLKPTNIQAIQRNRSGSKRLSPIQTRDALLWVSLTGRRVHEFAYVFASDNYEAPDMTLRAEHTTEGGIVDTAFQNEPDPVLWCVTGNGVLLGFSYSRQNQITAWFRRTTDGLFESVAAMRSSGDADRVWVVVKRTINGATKRYIERFSPDAQEFDFSTPAGFCYVDSAKKISQASSTTVSGLSHLEGEAVKVWADGQRIETKIVSGGAITLGAAATSVVVGLPYTAKLQPNPIEVMLPTGTAQGRRFNAERIQLMLHKSMGGKFSNDPALTGDDIGYPSGTSGVFTGRIDEHIPPEWLDALTLTFTHAEPTPFNLLGFVLKAEISGT